MQKFLSENLYPANSVDSYGMTRASLAASGAAKGGQAGGVLSFVINFASFTNSQI